MQKRLKKTTTKPPAKPKRPTDPNRAAHSMLAEHMARAEETSEPATPLDFAAQYRDHMAKLGEKGGKIGGKRWLETMTPERRSEIALKAARAPMGEIREEALAGLFGVGGCVICSLLWQQLHDLY